ncbi:2Fe-2S iron-sulfur cluster-binding protein [Niveispirillum fermenti]|uniref:2Fe-2S iron-sulfur cluster-binding protein n=1 Tax=Niveispirillum fermenti TaxID=1233113 RepID=UPI003A8B62C8
MVDIIVTDRDASIHRLDVEDGQSLMRALTGAGLDVPALCGGARACATCHVHIDPDWAGRLPAQEEGERELVSEEPSFIDGRSRLSCQIPVTTALDGLALTLAPLD